MTMKSKSNLDEVAAYIVELFPSPNAFEQHLSLTSISSVGTWEAGASASARTAA